VLINDDFLTASIIFSNAIMFWLMNLKGCDMKYLLKSFFFHLVLGFKLYYMGKVFISSENCSDRFSGPQNLLLLGFCRYFPWQ
jgi:hypothetical protein